MPDIFSKYVTPKQKIFYGLLASMLFCVTSSHAAMAQSNDPIHFQITEIPLPINVTEVKPGEKLLLSSCGLLQSPNHQDTLAYCYGNVTTSNTQVEKAWIQLLSTQDDTLSWIRNQPFSFVYDTSVGRRLEALDNHHHLINSEQRSGLGYVPLIKKDLSILNRALTYNTISPQVPIYQKNSEEEYFDPQSVVLTEGGSLLVLKLDHLKNKDFIYENYMLTQFDSMNKALWQTSVKGGFTYGVIEAYEDQQNRLKSPPDENASFMGIWLLRSSLAQPRLIANTDGRSFVYFGTSQYDPDKTEAPNEYRLGTKFYCISPDGKSKSENFIPGEFFHSNAAVFSSAGNVLLLQDQSLKNKKEFLFNIRTINAECVIDHGKTLILPALYPPLPLKNEDGSSVTGFATEILQVKTTASGDIIVVYLEEPNDWDVDQNELFPYQLNIAIFSQEGNLKAAKPIISADYSNAWYIHQGIGGDYFFPSQLTISVDLKINADDHSAFISIFNKSLLDENADRENEIGKNATWQGATYQAQPKFFKITW